MIYCGGHGGSPQTCIYLVTISTEPQPLESVFIPTRSRSGGHTGLFASLSLVGVVLMFHHNTPDTISNIPFRARRVHKQTHAHARARLLHQPTGLAESLD